MKKKPAKKIEMNRHSVVHQTNERCSECEAIEKLREENETLMKLVKLFRSERDAAVDAAIRVWERHGLVMTWSREELEKEIAAKLAETERSEEGEK